MARVSVEKTISAVASMDRDELISLLHDIHCSFPLDFSQEYLNSITLERLRHITLAACLHRRKNCA